MAAIDQALRFDATGRTARVTPDTRLRQMIETVLFTRPGERLNRSDFGSGLDQLVFAAASPEVATATEYLVLGALQRWAGGIAQIQAVDVAADEASLVVTVRYLPFGATTPEVARIAAPAGALP